jgi:acyl carrier protein
MDAIDQTIHTVLRDVGEEESLPITEVFGEQKLVDDLGFDSLTMARIIAILENQLHADPFSSAVAITSIRTVNDLANAYRQCLEGKVDTAGNDAVLPMDPAQQRAQARRNAVQRRRAA